MKPKSSCSNYFTQGPSTAVYGHVENFSLDQRQRCYYCSIGTATNSIGDTYRALMQVSVIPFICCIDMGISDTFSLIFLTIFDTNRFLKPISIALVLTNKLTTTIYEYTKP